jgi:phage terminase large subunit-like protein
MATQSKKKQVLRGATKPRLSSVPLKGKSRIDELVAIAELLKKPLLPWQLHVGTDMLKVDSKDQFVRKSTLLIQARQNGKSHFARMLCLAHLFKFNSKNVLIMSSNRSMALTSFREMVYDIENTPELMAQVKQIRHANGTESIELLNGNRLDVVAASRDGSRGRTVSFLWIDELREISEEGFTAATPTTRAVANAQTLFTSNAGDAFSTVLNNMRERALSYPPKSLGYYEYSANQYCKIDLNSDEFWQEISYANPALGYTITKENIEEAIATSSLEATRTEILSSWIDSLSSPFPAGIFEETSDSDLVIAPGALTIFAFDVSPSRRNASLVAGQILPNGQIGFGLMQTWQSQVSVDDLKIAAEIKAWADQYRPRMVCYDKYTTQSIADRLANAGVVVEDVSGQKFYQACGDLLDALVNHRVVHSGQAELITQFNNCAAKQNETAWRIVKRKSAGDVSAPIGIAMVVSKLSQPQSKPQIVA